MTEAQFNWKQPAGKALELALNRALALDAETQAALRGLDGQRVALTLTSPPLALEIRVDGEALRVGPRDAQREPDLGVRSTLAGLLGQLPHLLGGASRRDDAPPIGRMEPPVDRREATELQQPRLFRV